MIYEVSPELMAPAQRAVNRAEAAKALREVQDLFADRNNWTMGTLARDAHAQPVGATAPEAVRWCLLGALQNACFGGGRPLSVYQEAHQAMQAVLRESPTQIIDLATWNDKCKGSMQPRTLAALAADRLNSEV